MKIRWLILAIVAIALVLCACGADDDAEETIPSDVQEGDSQIALYSDEKCALTLESVGKDGADYCWTVQMENKTGGTLVFTVDRVYVNDFEADPVWAQSAPAMATTASAISWPSATLDACGIRSVDRVDLLLTVSPNKDGTDPIVQEKLTVYPNGEAAYQPASFTAGAGDTVLIDEPETLLFAATGADPDGAGGYTLNVYLENRSEREQDYTVKNVKVNGQICDPSWYRTIDAGKKCFTYINWYTEDLQHMEIYEVSKIEFDLVASDAATQAKSFEQHCVVEP